MSYAWSEPFAGAAAVAIRLVGGRSLTPPVSWMGGKRRLAGDVAGIMGVPRGRPGLVRLADAGPWGWVWTLLLGERSAEVCAALRGWEGEHPRDLWDRLASEPPHEDPATRAAQWLWLQARSASGVPVWWDGWRLAEAPGAWEQGSAGGRPPQPAGQRGEWRFGARPCDRAPDRRAGQCGMTNNGGMVNPSTIAERIEALRLAFGRTRVEVLAGDAAELEPAPGFAYLDPPYVGCTGYGWDCPREAVLELAQLWHDAGAVVGVAEAEPLELEGWHHVELTLPGGKPEWLTVSREPARLPDRLRQRSLFR